MLRIDDLDRERVRREYLRDIFAVLHFLDIPWDEGPRDEAQFEKEFSQVHRLPLYKEALKKLQSTGLLFGCSCSRSQLQQEAESGYTGRCRYKNIPIGKEGVCWRLRTDIASVKMTDGDGIEHTCTFPASMQDFIVRKKDMNAAYQLASVCDDIYFGVDLVVRGNDLRDSTLAQLYLASLLQDNHFEANRFYHHGLLKDDVGMKLSKSSGACSVHHLRRSGKTKAEIFTLLLNRLGISGTAGTWEELAEILFDNSTLLISKP